EFLKSKPNLPKVFRPKNPAGPRGCTDGPLLKRIALERIHAPRFKPLVLTRAVRSRFPLSNLRRGGADLSGADRAVPAGREWIPQMWCARRCFPPVPMYP